VNLKQHRLCGFCAALVGLNLEIKRRKSMQIVPYFPIGCLFDSRLSSKLSQDISDLK
jgi:hypothetical protein